MRGLGRPWPRGNPGRPRGSKNKVTRAFREGVLDAYVALGGAEALADWGREHPTEFYRLCGRLIPHEIVGPNDEPALMPVVIHEIRSK